MKTQKGAHAYSSLFACLYDEPEGLGNMHGYHYSVFRAVTHFDEAGETRRNCNLLHHFAVIWDDDHDTRIISVIEQLHIANLLRTIAFIGEHKGEVNVLFAPRFASAVPPQQHDYCRKAITDIIAKPIHRDAWTTQFGHFIPAKQSATDTANLLGMPPEVEYTYLSHIHNMWGLGVRMFEASDSASTPEHDGLTLFMPPPPPVPTVPAH